MTLSPGGALPPRMKENMSTQIMFAHQDGVFVASPGVRSVVEAPRATAPTKRIGSAITGEDIPSLVTIVRAGLLALTTFGSVFGPI